MKPWVPVAVGVLSFVLMGESCSTASAPPTSSPASADNGTPVAAASASASKTPAAPQVLLDVQGNGTKTTQKFAAAGDWDLNWSYDCSSFGYQGNFAVEIYNGDASLNFDNQGVNQLGMKGADVEHYHSGGTFYLTIDSECSWHVTAKG